ncbi:MULTISPECIES: type II toxin-antitoxin system RelE/ParE family toxin [Endozoicomonas]|uniref:type II toxin-antitoxin system RelE/ParE family toxin n=1 Tax=Endozoicomonas TaxID=305899 RepID=UPI00082548B3|nr:MULTISPECIES: type II toxin-antitoxin system RelE/ParE family toxin [Endozoicomonas]USE36778.1 type II toxin-antitoxin system RelE/ParE family toxin [Endozoicomonas sp. SCSIO W0465]
MKLRFSRSAVDDLKRLRAFIAEKNPAAAKRMASILTGKIRHLCEQPRMGVLVGQELNPCLRDLIVGHYTVRYLANDNEVVILKVWHHKEDTSTLDIK